MSLPRSYSRWLLAALLAAAASTTYAQTTPPTPTPPDTLRAQEIRLHPDATAQQTPGPLALRTVAAGRAQVLVPEAFRPLAKDAIAMKYPAQGGPQEAFSDNALAVNLAFRYGPNPMTQAQLTPELATKVLKALSYAQPGFQELSHGVRKINDRQVVFLEFLSDVPLSPAPDDRVYSLMFITDADGKVLVGTFNCVTRLQAQWQPVAQRLMTSLQVK